MPARCSCDIRPWLGVPDRNTIFAFSAAGDWQANVNTVIKKKTIRRRVGSQVVVHSRKPARGEEVEKKNETRADGNKTEWCLS